MDPQFQPMDQYSAGVASAVLYTRRRCPWTTSRHATTAGACCDAWHALGYCSVSIDLGPDSPPQRPCHYRCDGAIDIQHLRLVPQNRGNLTHGGSSWYSLLYQTPPCLFLHHSGQWCPPPGHSLRCNHHCRCFFPHLSLQCVAFSCVTQF